MTYKPQHNFLWLRNRWSKSVSNLLIKISTHSFLQTGIFCNCTPSDLNLFLIKCAIAVFMFLIQKTNKQLALCTVENFNPSSAFLCILFLHILNPFQGGPLRWQKHRRYQSGLYNNKGACKYYISRFLLNSGPPPLNKQNKNDLRAPPPPNMLI